MSLYLQMIEERLTITPVARMGREMFGSLPEVVNFSRKNNLHLALDIPKGIYLFSRTPFEVDDKKNNSVQILR